ncbi:hypothetical protein ONZ45_g2160 [Pleurotus djamor]|nr:hypothetical protein ONZ45_g2160 [Pleurotus djamor]
MSAQVASSSESNAILPESTSMRSMKRKLDDAFSILDDAVGTSEQPIAPPPTKKTATSRSFYSTLAKYGIKSKPKEAPVIPDRTDSIKGLSKPTPHLSAILHRAATRTRKALPSFKSSSSISTTSPSTPLSSAPSGVEYRPSSTASFLSRLATFKLATYANKPVAIDAVAAAKCGWINDGKDRLLCRICRASWVVVGREGMSRDAGNTLVEKQHSIYRIQLKPPASMAQELKSTALTLEPVLEGVEIKHPLTLAQVNSLRTAVSFVALPPSLSDLNLVPPNNENATESSPPPLEPSETALLTSLFGWTVAPQTTADRNIYPTIYTPDRATINTVRFTFHLTRQIYFDINSWYCTEFTKGFSDN